jgi:hypothetical protein
MRPAPLPYDMGNAGDLVKHGVLAEFTQWWCEQECRCLRYLDPFGGRPWVSPPEPEVTRRVQALSCRAIRDAQPDPAVRYYGSSLVVLNAARAVGGSAIVWSSDSDPEARHALAECNSSLQDLKVPGFSSSDGFSILGCDVDADLLLLDPFADFLPNRADREIPRMANIASRMACVLFVLNLDPTNCVGRRYCSLRSKHLPSAWSLHCPRIPDTPVRGESRYEVEVLLAWQRLMDHPHRDILRNRLQSYANCLSAVMRTKITFSEAD